MSVIDVQAADAVAVGSPLVAAIARLEGIEREAVRQDPVPVDFEPFVRRSFQPRAPSVLPGRQQNRRECAVRAASLAPPPHHRAVALPGPACAAH